MLYSRVSWFIDLLTHFLHYYYYFFILPLFFIIPHCLYPLFHHLSFSSFYLFILFIFYFLFFMPWVMNDLSHFSAWRMVISPSTPILWTLVQRSLVKRDILLEIVRLHHCLRVYPFNYVFLVELICWYSEYAQVKRKKEKKE